MLFIYNADSDRASKMLDWAHKLLKPSTYSCQLCSITHGIAGPKKSWSAFIDQLPVEVEFLYKDKWLAAKNPVFNFPVILVKNNSALAVLISAEEIKKIKTPEELIARINKSLDVK